MDYAKIGLRCGIEIHQQLETDKLFCSCPSLVNDPHKPDIRFSRRLRAVVGETGKVDRAAKHEQQKERVINYEACSTSSCLVEMDEEPPHELNREALDIALQVARLLNAKVVDEIHVMRKTVVDGSNVSGFQRTALVAMDGYIDTSEGRVSIPTICLEEEAAKKIREGRSSVTYRLDRLGVPLVEIGTGPDIRTPEQARETAKKLGMVLRSTGRVKRGIGTIRQDVNVSIKGGSRIEIKGFQDLKTIPKVIENEIKRQKKLVEKGRKVPSEVRKAEPDGTTSFLRPMPGAARMYPETDISPIRPDTSIATKLELLDDKARRFEAEFGLGRDLADAIVRVDYFEEFTRRFRHIKPAYLAEALISIPKELRRKKRSEEISKEDFAKALELLDAGKITKNSLADVVHDISAGAFDLGKYETVSLKEVEKDVKKIVSQMKGKPFGAVMGEVMKRYGGRVDGRAVSQMIRKYM